MIFPRFLRRDRAPDTISSLYGMIVAQARMPVFYRDYGVPDTVDGRFELVLLHLYLVLRRLSGERELGQQIFDLFCRDMDRNLREIGISDLKVPSEMRRIGEAYYGRAKAYDMALASHDSGELNRAISRNVFATAPPDSMTVQRFAAYIRAMDQALAAQDSSAFNRGVIDFPQAVSRPT
jgi:cytochrome b pre-mRNA-processing protein 3